MKDSQTSSDALSASQNREWVPTFFLAGYQKTASTWLHRCLLEHPDVYVPEGDATHFFDIYFHRGLDWYRTFFQSAHGYRQIGDTTPSFMRFHTSRVRMAQLNPAAKIIVTLRNPIERAFSHYWHEKKKRKINYRFEECLSNNVDIFDDWIATGFYYSHLTDLLTMYPRDQVLILFYDDLKASPADFLAQTLRFLEVDADFTPSVLSQAVNKAWYRPTWGEMFENLKKGQPLRESEYDRGIDPEFRKQLQEVFRQQNEQLAKLVGRDLSHWK